MILNGLRAHKMLQTLLRPAIVWISYLVLVGRALLSLRLPFRSWRVFFAMADPIVELMGTRAVSAC